METNSRKVTTVTLDWHGRHHTFDGATHNIHALYAEEVGEDKANAETDAEDDTGLHAFEERWLLSHGITHVVDYEDLGDEKEHPIAAFLALGE